MLFQLPDQDRRLADNPLAKLTSHLRYSGSVRERRPQAGSPSLVVSQNLGNHRRCRSDVHIDDALLIASRLAELTESTHLFFPRALLIAKNVNRPLTIH